MNLILQFMKLLGYNYESCFTVQRRAIEEKAMSASIRARESSKPGKSHKLEKKGKAIDV